MADRSQNLHTFAVAPVVKNFVKAVRGIRLEESHPLKLDFPLHKKLSLDEKAQNEQLAKKYVIQGFPSFVLVDASGKEVRRQEGYREGGSTKFLKWARGEL
jgi:thioredoxin-related protein